MAHDARIIPLVKDRAAAEATPVMKSVHPWLGESVGWYEGDALMILTRNVNPAQRGYISPAGKVIERLTRWNDDQITYEFTVEDPTATPSLEGRDRLEPLEGRPLRIRLPRGQLRHARHPRRRPQAGA